MRMLIAAVLLIAGVSAYAQNGIVEMLRQDLKTEKTAIMTAASEKRRNNTVNVSMPAA